MEGEIDMMGETDMAAVIVCGCITTFGDKVAMI
jgi:hypothetical protein